MKILIAGGSGHLGRISASAWRRAGHEVVVLSRGVPKGLAADRVVHWDGRTLGSWAAEVDGADVVLNLAGRSVDCRYTVSNLRQMMDSRVESTRVIGSAIAQASRPPKTWLQMSTATIYAHRFDADNDETAGLLGGQEADAPARWRFSIEIATAWERELDAASTPHTRKLALRTAMVMSPFEGGPFRVLQRMARAGLGGPVGSGEQFVSWIHWQDYQCALDFLIDHGELAGAVNLAAPRPLRQRDFMAQLRAAVGARVGLPASRWMVEIGARLLRTDSELILKSRRVTPGRLRSAGFQFRFPQWEPAARDLVNPSSGLAPGQDTPERNAA